MTLDSNGDEVDYSFLEKSPTNTALTATMGKFFFTFGCYLGTRGIKYANDKTKELVVSAKPLVGAFLVEMAEGRGWRKSLHEQHDN